VQIRIRNPRTVDEPPQYARRNVRPEDSFLSVTQNRLELSRSARIERHNNTGLSSIGTQDRSLEPLDGLLMPQSMLAGGELIQKRSGRLSRLEILLGLQSIDVIWVDLLGSDQAD